MRQLEFSFHFHLGSNLAAVKVRKGTGAGSCKAFLQTCEISAPTIPSECALATQGKRQSTMNFIEKALTRYSDLPTSGF
jgi:hypothetical protein